MSTVGLVAELTEALGERGCLTAADDIARYATDWRGLCHGQTLCVARPASLEDLQKVVRACSAAATPIVPQGGNTGLAAASAPDGPKPAVVLALDRLANLYEVNPLGLVLTADAGCILATAQAAAVDAGLRLPLSLGAEGSCQLGGVVSTNAGGNQTIRFGNTRDLVLGLEVVLADGTVLSDLPGLRKNNAGYDLKQLFIGAEGTLGVVTKVALKLQPAPVGRVTALLEIADTRRVLQLFRKVRDRHAENLTAFEMIPRALLNLVVDHVPGTRNPLAGDTPWAVLIELDTSGEVDHLRLGFEATLEGVFADDLVTDGVVAADEAQSQALWRLRESLTEAHRAAGYGMRHDISVPIADIPDFIDRATAAVVAVVPDARVVPFGHVGDGNVHFNLIAGTADLDGAALRAKAPAISDAVYRLAVDMGGSFSAEHGVGRLKIHELERFRPTQVRWGRAIKSVLDPQGLMNPGVLWPSP